MGRKNVVKSFKMFDDGDISGTITSSETNVINLDKASIHITWTGSSPVGVLTIEASNQDPDKNSPAVVWKELDFGSAIDVTGNSGEHDIIFNELPFNVIRVVYTSTSGTGSINATLTAKTQGA